MIDMLKTATPTGTQGPAAEDTTLGVPSGLASSANRHVAAGVVHEAKHDPIHDPLHATVTLTSGVVQLVRDVAHETAQRRVAQEHERLRRQLSQAQKLEAIGQLVSGVAHELNNPLAAVMAYAQIVLSGTALEGDDLQAMETIIHETKRAAKIVSSLLTFARQHQPERTITDLNQIVSDTIALRRYAITDQDIALTLDLDGTLPLTWADNFQMQQVLLNLLGNAEQALRGWSGPRTLSISTASCGETITLTVSDTGPGISAPDLEQIFNPFFTTKGVGEGTGLGLAISDGIVREHGGRIRVESTLGAGATFIVELPYVDPSTHIVDRPALRRGARPYITERSR